ncbi:MAG: hypothetical protein JWN72_400, partial [Thermoleophilia bacterium]|nr:hypothetical protein [Thermoleophilia bacterium]
YCNTASRSSHGFPGAHAAATTAINLVPELWYISAPGVASKVVSSSRPYAVSGVSALTDSVYATFDATSTPQLADLERETQFLVVTHPFVAPVNALTRPGAASVVGWPGRRASVRTGVRFTCPLGTRGTCVVRARLTSKQYGVTRTVGTSVIRVKPGRSAQVNVLLNASGRWRYANEGLVATLTVDAAAAVPKVRHATGSWGVRVRAPR